MKTANPFISSLAAIVIAAGLAGCAKSGGDKPADATEQPEAKAGVTIDAATQERIGLKMEFPTATQWQPEIHAVGHVVDPLVFMAAVADYESARASATASQNELARTQKLAAQDNASPRVLETAQAAAAHDALALDSAAAKFTADWGVGLAARTDLAAFAKELQTDNIALVKVSLPVGTFLNPLPATATIFTLNNTDPITAEFANDLGIDPTTQTQTLLFSVKQKMPPSLSVAAAVKIPGTPTSGVSIPASAVLRHEGKGWAYLQAETNQFVRTEIPLDRLTGDGSFFTEELAATNRIVVSGAQTILSAELGGGFTTGGRD